MMASNMERNLLIVNFVVSGLAFALCIVSATTKNWLHADAILSRSLTSRLNYGLFAGTVERKQLAARLQFDLAVVCDFAAGACMYSCQQEAAARDEELRRVLAGAALEPCEQARFIWPRHFQQRQNATDTAGNSTHSGQLEYIPVGLWFSAVFLLVLCAAFGLSAVAFALLNLYANPVERICHIFGLYIWNGGAALCGALALVIWATLHAGHLQRNVAITDTLRSELTFSSLGRAGLGYSFYALLLSFAFSLLSNGVLLLRRRLMLQSDAPTAHTAADQTDVPLEFY